MSTTLKTMRDKIRSFYGLTTAEFTNTSLTDFINTAQPNIIIDLVKAGLCTDNFRKTTVLTYDLNDAQTAVVATEVCSITTNKVHGYTVGDFILWDKNQNSDDEPHPDLAGEYEITVVPSTVIFSFNLNVIDGFWGQGAVSLGYAVLPSDILDMDNAIEKVEVKFQEWGVTGGGAGAKLEKGWNMSYVPATKRTISDGVDTNYLNTGVNSFEKASSTEPVWWIDGNKSGIKVLHIRPIRVEGVRLRYRFKPAALSADADVITIPDEHTDLIRIYCKRFIEEKRGQTSEKQQAIQDYENELKLTIAKYSTGKQVKETEKEETKTK